MIATVAVITNKEITVDMVWDKIIELKEGK